MKLEIASSDDLVGLYAAYIELVARGQDASLELDFAPGVYGIASIGPIGLDLGGNPPPKDPRVDIVLRGRAGQPPVVLRDMGLRIHARSVHLENLILSGRQQGVLEARVARSFSMRDCVVALNTWGGPWGGVLLRVGGVYGQPPFKVEIEDTWFVANAQESASSLLAIAPATGSYIERVRLSRVTLLANGNSADVSVDDARSLRLDDVLAVKQHAAGVVLRFARAREVVIERGTFVVDDPRAIAREDTPDGSVGIDVRASQLYTSSTSRALPSCVRGRFDIRRSAPPPKAALDELVAELATRIPDSGAAARVRVHEALGIP